MAVIAFPGGSVPAPDALGNPLADAHERNSALDTSTSWIVEAPAGSGKTGLLIQRFLKLLGMAADPAEVLALTFTEKATAEMRDRIVTALQNAQDGSFEVESDFDRLTLHLAQSALQQDANQRWRLLDRPYQLNIRTIDSLCNEIARSVPLLAGGVGYARPVRDANPLYRRAAHAVLMRVGGGNDPALNQAVETLLLHRDGNLMYCEGVLASMLGTREQWSQLIPLEGDALTDEALDREVLPRLNGALERTLCPALARLRNHFPEHLLQRVASTAQQLAHAEPYNNDPNPFLPCAALHDAPGTNAHEVDHWRILANLLLTNEGSWRAAFAKNHLRVTLTSSLKSSLDELARELRDDAELAELLHDVRTLPPPTYPAEQWTVAKALFRLLRDTLDELQLLFAREEVCDFTAIALAARSALKDNAGGLSSLGVQTRHLLVDEMQDTSSVQYELLENFTNGWDGRSRTVFLVGDPKQSIYLFRQARVERFQKAMKDGKLRNLELGVLQLSTNFRSGKWLVQAFNDLFGQVFPPERASEDDVSYTPASAVLPARPAEGLNWSVEPLPFSEGDTERSRLQRVRALGAEAETIAERIKAWRAQHGATSNIAVLTRSRTHVTEITSAFTRSGIAFRAVEMDPLGKRQEVLDILAITRALLHPADRTAWLAVLRAPWCGVALAELHTLACGDASQQRKQSLRARFRQRAALLPEQAQQRVLRTLDVMDAALRHTGTEPLASRVERTWRSLGGDACTGPNGRQNVSLYLRMLDTMDSDGSLVSAHTLKARLEQLYAEPSHAEGAVDIMTIHKAKGLEWDLVLIPGTHRPPARDAWAFLNWLELPTHAPDGTRDVLLAPLPPGTGDAGLLNLYMKNARDRRASAEVKRLLYVAATRARTSLQLFAWPANKKDGDVSRVKDTLYGVAQNALPEISQPSSAKQDLADRFQDDFAEPLALAAAAGLAERPRERKPATIQRLAAHYDPLEQLHRTSLPMTRGAKTLQRLPRPEGSFGARTVGSVIHAFIQRLTHEFAAPGNRSTREALGQQLLSSLGTWRPAIRATLSSSGLPPAEVERASQTVLRALRTMLESQDGRWLLLPHRQAATESSWRSPDPEQTRQVRLDRSFFAGPQPHAPGENILWIVDFKTGDHDRDRETFLQAERKRYEPQVRAYAEFMLRSHPATTPIMLALYYPLMGRLIHWPYNEIRADATVPEVSDARDGKVQMMLFSN